MPEFRVCPWCGFPIDGEMGVGFDADSLLDFCVRCDAILQDEADIDSPCGRFGEGSSHRGAREEESE